MIVLCFIMQGEDMIEHTNDKCRVLVCKRKIFLSILISSVICVHYYQLVEHCVACAYTS